MNGKTLPLTQRHGRVLINVGCLWRSHDVLWGSSFSPNGIGQKPKEHGWSHRKCDMATGLNLFRQVIVRSVHLRWRCLLSSLSASHSKLRFWNTGKLDIQCVLLLLIFIARNIITFSHYIQSGVTWLCLQKHSYTYKQPQEHLFFVQHCCHCPKRRPSQNQCCCIHLHVPRSASVTWPDGT